MCGICGIYNFATGEPADRRLLQTMADRMVHRGPDDEGFHLDGPLGLGMRRLSIIDLAGGAQPISNESGTVWTVVNGELYNFADLRGQLEGHGHRFKTRSDTEIVVHAYEQWGIEFLTRLNGMFALAVWDASKRLLIVARDPFGIKPVYFHNDGRRIIFGSEIRALLCDRTVSRQVDPVALDQYLTLSFVPSPKTAFMGISKLNPGHALICDRDGVRVHRFHRVVPAPGARMSESEIVSQLRDAIANAVKRQMVADVPVGAMLSGGVDSSTVATIMSRLSDGPIETFTVGFAGDFAQNELEPARTVAARIGSRHHEVVLSAVDYDEFLSRSIWYLEEPVATMSTLAFYRVCKLARQHVKVALSGQGADEPFAGYPRYLGERYGPFYRAVPAPVRRLLIAPAVERLPRSEQLKRAVRSLDTAESRQRMARIYSIVDSGLKRRLYRDGLVASDDLSYLDPWQADVAGLDPLSQMLYVDSRLSLPDNLLAYTDKMSMAVSLEVRVPFLDLELMALVESIPSGLKIRRGVQKYILKQAVTEWLPPQVINRKKVGFATPVDGWFRHELSGGLQDRLLSPGSACRRYFAPEVIAELIRDHRSGRHDHKRTLFSLLTFELWHEQFIRPAVWSEGVPSPRAVSAGAGSID